MRIMGIRRPKGAWKRCAVGFAALAVASVSLAVPITTGSTASANTTDYTRDMQWSRVQVAAWEDCVYAHPKLTTSSPRGRCVQAVQILLNKWDPYREILSPDGVFGAKTKAKLMRIQGWFSLTKTGVVGIGTWNALTLDCRTSMTCHYMWGPPVSRWY
jgi:peptidoglycan hydrolase-like protein with peptidoglycan-binding domain